MIQHDGRILNVCIIPILKFNLKYIMCQICSIKPLLLLQALLLRSLELISCLSLGHASQAIHELPTEVGHHEFAHTAVFRVNGHGLGHAQMAWSIYQNLDREIPQLVSGLIWVS